MDARVSFEDMTRLAYIQKPPMMNGIQNHIFNRIIFQVCTIVRRANKKANTTAAGRFGT